MSCSSFTRVSIFACFQDYDAAGEDELSFKTGDIITVLQAHDDGWAEGELNGQSGAFPVVYTEPVE